MTNGHEVMRLSIRAVGIGSKNVIRKMLKMSEDQLDILVDYQMVDMPIGCVFVVRLSGSSVGVRNCFEVFRGVCKDNVQYVL